jgi:hypothetical protein
MGNAETKGALVEWAAEEAESDDKLAHTPPALQPGKCSPLMDALVDDFRSDHEGDENANQAKHVETVTDEKLPHDSKPVSSRNDCKRSDKLLEEEIAIRHQIRTMPGAQGKGGICYAIVSTVVNMACAILIFAVYLISFETLLSIGLSVGLTICKSLFIKTILSYAFIVYAAA